MNVTLVHDCWPRRPHGLHSWSWSRGHCGLRVIARKPGFARWHLRRYVAVRAKRRVQAHTVVPGPRVRDIARTDRSAPLDVISRHGPWCARFAHWRLIVRVGVKLRLLSACVWVRRVASPLATKAVAPSESHLRAHRLKRWLLHIVLARCLDTT